METYNEALITVDDIQTDIERLNNLTALSGEQPANVVLCILFPFAIKGLESFALLTKRWWIKLIIGSVITALKKFQEDMCKK